MFNRSKGGDSPEKLRARAERNVQKGNLEDALEQFRQAIAAYRQAGNYQEAASLGHEVGHGLYRAQEWNKACLFLEAAIPDYYKTNTQSGQDGVLRAYPRWMREVPECQYWLGCSQSSAQRYPEAIANLRRAALAFKATNVEKRAADSFLMWGAALRDYGFATKRERLLRMALAKFDLANHHFEQAVKGEEDGAEVGPGVVYVSAAPAFLELGKYVEVIAAYPEVKRILAQYGDQKQRQWASEVYEKALARKKEAESKR